MASGHVTALTGRTHGCTDPQSDVKILLANSEPSTHGTKRKCRNASTMSALGSNPDGICSPRAFPLMTHMRHSAASHVAVAKLVSASGRAVYVHIAA
jgi:hypothetical protein